MIGALFESLVIQPIFNLLVLIYAITPGHNFGVALIVFTLIISILTYPLLKKQLHHTKKMRELQPELQRIKKENKGDRQTEAKLMMELYKERGFSPFGQLPALTATMLIFIGLFQGLRRLIEDSDYIFTGAYQWLQNMEWMQGLAERANGFDFTFLNVIDLSQAAYTNGVIYWPAMLLVLGSAFTTYLTIKQTMPKAEDARTVSDILKEAKETGEQPDQQEMMKAMTSGKGMQLMLPVLIFIVTVGFAAALALYWFVNGVIRYIMQVRILHQDEEELEEIASQKSKVTIKNASNGKQQVESKKKPNTKNKKPAPKNKPNKRRR